MIVLQTVAVAFAMFSAVPVPQFNWTEKNMRYAMCAFPLIGVVIGLLWFLCGVLPLPGAAQAAGSPAASIWTATPTPATHFRATATGKRSWRS